MPRSFCRNDSHHISFRATAAYSPGDIIQKHGKVGIVEGEDAIAIGDEVTVRFDALVEVDKAAAATVFAEDAAVGYDSTNKNAVAGGAGDFDMGKAVKGGSAAGVESVWVLLNF